MRPTKREAITQRGMEAHIEANLLKKLEEVDVFRFVMPTTKGLRSIPQSGKLQTLTTKHGITTVSAYTAAPIHAKSFYIKLNAVYEVNEELISQIANTLVGLKFTQLREQATKIDIPAEGFSGPEWARAIFYSNTPIPAGPGASSALSHYHVAPPLFEDDELNLKPGEILILDEDQKGISPELMIWREKGQNCVRFNVTGTHLIIDTSSVFPDTLKVLLAGPSEKSSA